MNCRLYWLKSRLRIKRIIRRRLGWRPLRSKVVWAFFAVLAIGLLLSWWKWDDLHHGKAAPDIEVVGGLGLLLGGAEAILLALWRSWVGAQQLNTAELTLSNERYQRGAEMLGHQSSSARLGGISALQNLVEEHPKEYHRQVMKILCAFVRRPPTDAGDDRHQNGSDVKTPIREDAQTAVTAIGELHGSSKTFSKEFFVGLNLKGANLRSANLEGLYLASAVMPDDASGKLSQLFDGARGTELCEADLEGARLFETDVSGVFFSNRRSNPATGLTSRQLLEAHWDPSRPPRVQDIFDADSGKCLREELIRIGNQHTQES